MWDSQPPLADKMSVREVGGDAVYPPTVGGTAVVTPHSRTVGATGSRGGGYTGGHCSGVGVFLFFQLGRGHQTCCECHL